ncbi:MAG: methionine biosynthesis protein MetW [Alphaproteobacteria bacterium]
MTGKAPLRHDLRVIAELVQPRSTLLDIGCGEGDLMHWLSEHKEVKVRGMELGLAGVNAAISKGLSVIQGDANTDLKHYPAGVYDYVVLSQTLQALNNPRDVLEQMVRIGRHAIVSVPNFGHWKNRLYLACKGRMPVTKTLSYQWYDTPNIHFCTITDFVLLCRELGLTIEKRLYVTHQGEINHFRSSGLWANMFGEQGVFMVRQ